MLCQRALLAQSDTTNINPWSGDIQFSFSNSSGNVNLRSHDYALQVKRSGEVNTIDFNWHFRNFIVSGTTVDEVQEGSILDIWRLSKRSRVYAKTSYYRNEFRGFDRRWKLGSGYLYQFVEKENFELATRTGYQMRISDVTIEGDYNQGLHHFLLVGFKSHLVIVENITLRVKLDYEQDFRRAANHIIESKGGFELKVNNWLRTLFTHSLLFSGLPIEGTMSLDQRISASIKIAFNES